MFMNILSNSIQQSVITAMNVVTNQLKSFSITKHSQIILKTTSKSRSKRWIIFDIKYFDLMYKSKSALTEECIEHAEKNIYFKNVHLFLKLVKNVIKIKNVNKVRKNLFICLRDLTLSWYISELFKNIKNLLELKNKVEFWKRELLKRFCEFISTCDTYRRHFELRWCLN
jgi:hypothetical protein